MKPKHVGDLAIDEAFSYQRKAWVVQRIAWCGFVLLLLAALLGLFGRGGFSQKRKATPDGALVLEYEKFLHMQSPEYIRLRVRDPGKNGTVAVWIANSYLEKIFIKQIVPEPNSTIAGQGRTVFVFSTPITNSEVFVKFNLDPEKPGRLSGLIGTGAGSELAFAQFVYP